MVGHSSLLYSSLFPRMSIISCFPPLCKTKFYPNFHPFFVRYDQIMWGGRGIAPWATPTMGEVALCRGPPSFHFLALFSHLTSHRQRFDRLQCQRFFQDVTTRMPDSSRRMGRCYNDVTRLLSFSEPSCNVLCSPSPHVAVFAVAYTLFGSATGFYLFL